MNDESVRSNAFEAVNSKTPQIWQESGLTRLDYEAFCEELKDLSTVQDVAWLLESYSFGDDLAVVAIADKAIKQLTGQAEGEVDWAPLQRALPALAEKLKTITEERALLMQEYISPRTYVQYGEKETQPLHIIERYSAPGTIVSPTVIMPGCFTGPEQLRDFCTTLAQYDRTIIAPEVFIPGSKSEYTDKKTTVSEAYENSLRASIEYFDETYSAHTYDLVGYSTGAIAALKVAAKQPDKFNSIILLNPVGLTNNFETEFFNKLQVAWGALKHMQQNGSYENTPAFQNFCAGWKERQAQRGWREVLDIIETAGETDIKDIIFALTHEYGIKIGILHGDGDKQFNAETAETTLGIQSDPDLTNLNSTESRAEFWTLNSTYTHTMIGRQPDIIASFVNDGFTSLETYPSSHTAPAAA